jgi:hypothetical protein
MHGGVGAVDVDALPRTLAASCASAPGLFASSNCSSVPSGYESPAPARAFLALLTLSATKVLLGELLGMLQLFLATNTVGGGGTAPRFRDGTLPVPGSPITVAVSVYPRAQDKPARLVNSYKDGVNIVNVVNVPE